jgi:hypothetical protein
MKRRTVLVVMLVVVFLLPGGTAPVVAGGLSGVTGGVGMEPPFGRVWLEFDVHQVDPSTYEANGMIHAQVNTPARGWKRLWYEAKCVSFTEVNGKPAATVVATIVRRKGWDEYPYSGDPGEHLKWQVVDGGTPGASGDTWSLQWYDAWNIEYWPADSEPGCSDYVGTQTIPVDYGNLVIH